jgi:hypothetical protein
MKPIFIRQFMYTFGIILLVAFLSACGSNPATPTVTAQPTATPTQASKPTQPPTPTPASNTGVTFQHFTGANFTIDYPAGWQTNHTSQPFKQSGNPQQQTENIYAFVAQDNITGLHIVRNGDEQAPGGMINQLLGGVFTCHAGDTSVPVQVGGVTWAQVDIVCFVASTNYEVRELVTSSPQYGQTVILYGAYQQVGNGAVAPDFAHASKTYFEPMLASFKFD